MQLTHYTDYSLRVLIYLSLQENSQRITIADIAENFNIPRNHLVKIVNRLGNLGYVHTTRGKKGGLRLGKKADQINVGDVVEKMESTLDVVNCEAPTPCPLKSNCTLKPILVTATDAFLDVLNQYTIADLAGSRNKLKVLLHF